MPFIDKTKIPRIGHQVIDDGHLELAERINALYAAWKAGAGIESLAELAGRIEPAAMKHFAEEMAIGRAAGIKGLEAHQRQHGELLVSLRGHLAGIVEGASPARIYDLFEMLARLLYEHEIVDDAAFHGIPENGEA